MKTLTYLCIFVFLFLMKDCHCCGESAEVRTARDNTAKTLSDAKTNFSAYLKNLRAYVDDFVVSINNKMNAVTQNIEKSRADIRRCADSQSKPTPTTLFTNVDTCVASDSVKGAAATAKAYAGLTVFENVPFELLPGLNYVVRKAECELTISSSAKAFCFNELSKSITTFLNDTKTKIQASSDQGDANAVSLVEHLKGCFNNEVNTMKSSLSAAGINYPACAISWQV